MCSFTGGPKVLGRFFHVPFNQKTAQGVNNLDHNMMPQQPAGIQCSPHSLTYEQPFPQTRQAKPYAACSSVEAHYEISLR